MKHLLLIALLGAFSQSRTDEVISFTGSVERNELFERPIGRGMLFQIAPSPSGTGWSVRVIVKKAPEDEHHEFCEPLHGGSECDFLGEYFVTSSTAAEYLKSRIRHFGIGVGTPLTVSEQEKKEDPDWWRVPHFERFGVGTMIVDDLVLGQVFAGKEPGIASMKFRVVLRLPG